jgi:rod shape determining protein RodA
MSSLSTLLGAARATVQMSWWRRFLVRFDWPLFGAMALLCSLGLANLYSATHGTPHSAKFEQQLVWMSVGLCVFVATAAIDHRTWLRLSWIALGVIIAAVIAVDVIGHTSKGSQRWIGYGGLRIQPSELAKIAVILAVARLNYDRASGTLSRAALWARIAALALPVVFIALQPDLGSASLVALIPLSVAFLTMARLWPLVATLGTGILALPVLWDHYMVDYQKRRVLSFLDPAADPTGAGWHTLQSIFAVGSGRLTGKGYLNATQNQFNFLPEHWTDFPFSVWAEEWGFTGCVFMIAAFAFLILWILHVALGARDEFGAIICLGVGAMLFWHVVVNIAMVLGLAPVVGVTLPLISYGGSSLLTVFVGLGLVASVSMRRHGY